MKFSIEHELPGRLRLRCPEGSFTQADGCVIAALLETQPGVTAATAAHRTGSLLIRYEGDVRASVLTAVEILDDAFYGKIDGSVLISEAPGLEESLASLFGGVVVRALLPRTLRYAVTFLRSLPLLARGLHSLWSKRRFNVSVLDASAVGVSMLRRDFRTATVITTLLTLGNLLESWTHKKSRESLTDSLALNIDRLWVKRDGQEVQISMSDLQIGDLAIIRTGSVIPVDGVVCEGDALVNQASMTGESEPIRRTPPLSVYAGTIVEEGELLVRVTAFDSETRIHKIAEMIHESEALKADIQNKAEKMADAIVPYSFLLAGGIYFWTRDAMRATAALLVDYSCAIRLSTPLTILSAMREGARRGILVKGGRFLEALAAADTVVFDKTGTLTVSAPCVARVVPFDGYTREEVLRTAACLEEHFPHSIARAVVRQAEKERLSHREEHSTVEYAVAHGIASRIPNLGRDLPGDSNQKVLIGSAHFVFEDEGVGCTPEQREVIDRESEKCSVLFLAVGGRLAGILCIEDPLREDARDVVRRLRETGITRFAMLTGDNLRVAENVAGAIGVEEVWAQLLPEDKAEVVKQLKKDRKVVMVGDGINDSPALASADVGVAMRSGADIAQEAADVVLSDNRLHALVDARRLSVGAMEKIYRNYAFIVGANSLLLGLGLSGTITPAMSALLHNLATIGSSLYSLTPILEKPCESDEVGART
ncbi:MAG: heavy metal translocating P-type ATPase [Synergistaceae bacterium]|jgi:Cu2+-exporting ATPase|nr:heavy metal translocating P-type ATPase [Synergistaceae bacterium]